LLNLLRQFSKLHGDKKQISVGMVGYPNTGKSSLINTMKEKKVCNVAPVPGETKVWQYVRLMKRVYLIDCPGVVTQGDDEVGTVLKGVVRVEALEGPEEYVEHVMQRVRKEYIQNTYGVKEWESAEDLLEQIAKKSGKLGKGGEPDTRGVSRQVLSDWIRGRLPFFTLPGKTAEDVVLGGKKEDRQEGPRRVEQNMKNIRVSSFVTEDLNPDEKEDEKVPEAVPIEAVVDGEEEVESEQEEADWDEVFEGETKVDDSSNSSEVFESSSSSSDDDEVPQAREDSIKVKTKRMTTSKTKATNYYTHANVKNRNRDKKQVRKKSSGRIAKK
jgi:nuclear GTP-binding protein